MRGFARLEIGTWFVLVSVCPSKYWAQNRGSIHVIDGIGVFPS